MDLSYLWGFCGGLLVGVWLPVIRRQQGPVPSGFRRVGVSRVEAEVLPVNIASAYPDLCSEDV
jgi:hypothetical protein